MTAKGEALSNISKTSARVSSGVPNSEKQMKTRGRRPSAFIVSRCLESLMKPKAPVFEMTSQTIQQKNKQWYIFFAIVLPPRSKPIRFLSECSLDIQPFMHVTQICLIYGLLPSWIINEFENLLSNSLNLPWVPEVFLLLGENFRCWPKAEATSGEKSLAPSIPLTKSRGKCIEISLKNCM